MGISHEYHAARGHGQRGGAGGKLRLLGVIAAILILSFAITAILENGQKHQDEAAAYGHGRHGAEHSGSAAHAGQCRRGQRHGQR